jgi:hypothetical protein
MEAKSLAVWLETVGYPELSIDASIRYSFFRIEPGGQFLDKLENFSSHFSRSNWARASIAFT